MTNEHVNFSFKDISLDEVQPATSHSSIRNAYVENTFQSPKQDEKLSPESELKITINNKQLVNVDDLEFIDHNFSQQQDERREEHARHRTYKTSEIVSFHDPNEFLTEKYMEEHYNFDNLRTENVLLSTGHYLRKYYTPSVSCGLSYLYKRVPFIKWIQDYNIRDDFLIDFVAGLTVGIVHIAQGIAYSLLAGLPAVNGLYMSFFSVLVYTFLGTSRHLSVGTHGVSSLLIVDAINAYEGILYPSINQLSQNVTLDSFVSNDVDAAKTLIGMSLAFYVGILQIILAIFHVGFFTKYLSDVIVNAFTIASAYHIAVSQINVVLGIKLKSIDMPFVIIIKFIEIFRNISQTKPATVIISVVFIIITYLMKTFINERYKKKLPIPIPVDFLMCIVGIVISYFGDFNSRWDVSIVGALPLGIPSPRMPPLNIITTMLGDIISIGIITFSINVSMAMLYAKKYKYSIRSNQEFFANGVANVVCSFFNGFPQCVALSRNAILEQLGAKTQICGIFSAFVILIVILFLGNTIQTLPNAVLAASIIVAVKNMCFEVVVIRNIYKKSKLEAVAWLATFLGVMILDTTYGFYIGVGFGLLLIIFKSQRARCSLLGRIPGTDVFEDTRICRTAEELEGIKIIRYEDSIYYANAENFRYKVIKLSEVEPLDVMTSIQREYKRQLKEYKKVMKKEAKNKTDDNATRDWKISNIIVALKQNVTKCLSKTEKTDSEIPNFLAQAKEKFSKNLKLKYIILDCSCVNYIDNQGVDTLIQLRDNYKEIGIVILLVYCKQIVIHSFKKYSFIRETDFEYIFSSIIEALRYIQKKHPADDRFRFVVQKRVTKDFKHQKYSGHDPDMFQWI